MHSIFELFKVGVGPSSSHTVGPMIAAQRFASRCQADPEAVANVARVQVKLYGSLALTGVGHATDTAILAGLSGCLPDRTEPDLLRQTVETLRQTQVLKIAGREIPFIETRDLIWLRNEVLPQHPNGMEFTAWSDKSELLRCEKLFSVGGGFVATEEELSNPSSKVAAHEKSGDDVPHPFTTAAELLEMARQHGKSIEQIVHANELSRRSEEEIARGLDRLWEVMRDCIDAGCVTQGILPGALRIARRAPQIYQRLSKGAQIPPSQWLIDHASRLSSDPLQHLDWISLFALAVNEQNAAGGRVVTAPTNGAAGIIPAVLAYYHYFMQRSPRDLAGIQPGNMDGIHRFLKTAGAIGLLYKLNASLSAAEMGCQGEVGVACSMAAAGLAACMGGSIEQIENAAEIGMEHNLGLTCDPIAGLVQVPCIERNTMGATKAVNAARLAVLYGDGKHFVSLDRVIETMRQTGVDMQAKYKETSLGGLAVNVVDC
jgi:L-serine dehydratase